MTPQQKAIFNFCFENGEITTKQAVGLAGGQYHNENKYVGEILARMVKNGTLERVKKGVFKISKKPKLKEADKFAVNQLKLL